MKSKHLQMTEEQQRELISKICETTECENCILRGALCEKIWNEDKTK